MHVSVDRNITPGEAYRRISYGGCQPGHPPALARTLRLLNGGPPESPRTPGADFGAVSADAGMTAGPRASQSAAPDRPPGEPAVCKHQAGETGAQAP